MKITGGSITVGIAGLLMLPIVFAGVMVAALLPAATSASTCDDPVGVVAGGWRPPLLSRYLVTSQWGPRFHPVLRVSKLHTGIDLVAGGDKTVVAASGGKVTTAGFNGAYGNQVVIDHGDYSTRYGHMAGAPKVKVGQKIGPGTPLGVQGATGYVTGPHLHFEVIKPNGSTIDPKPFMAKHGAPLDGKPVTAAKSSSSSAVAASTSTSTSTSTTKSAASTTSLTSTRADGQKVALRGEQLTNAATIAAVAREVNAGDRGIVIALMTALQESGLRNLNYGDRDSLGLFQQRAGWGTAKQRQTPRYSAQAFFGGKAGPNHGSPPGLLDTAGWKSLPLGQAAQKVQISAFPDAYDKWEPVAKDLLARVGGAAPTGCDAAVVGDLRVATYNVCLEFCDGLGSYRTRANRIADELKASGAAVVALQETGRKGSEGAAIRRAVAGTYRMAVYHRSKMLLFDPTKVAVTNAKGAQLPSRILDTAGRRGVIQLFRIKATGRLIVAASVHPVFGKTAAAESSRVAFMRRLLPITNALSAGGTRPVVIAGDMNTHFPGKGTRTRVAAYMATQGYRSAEQLTKNRTGAGLRSYNNSGHQGRGPRIDHVLVDVDQVKVAAWRLVRSPNPTRPPSDHNMIVADLALTAPPTPA